MKHGIKALLITLSLACAGMSQAVKDAVTGPVTPACPGSILQLHPDCILVADEEALSLL